MFWSLPAIGESMEDNRGRVLIVEDRVMLAESLAGALRSEGVEAVPLTQPSLDIVSEMIETDPPGMAIVAIGIGTGALTEQVVGVLAAAGIPTVVMTGGRDRVRVARCVAEGAVGIINRNSSFESVAAMVKEAAAPGELISTAELYRLQDELRRYRAELANKRRPFTRLSSREREVLHAMTQGHRAQRIADDSFVSVSTVRSQIRSILVKLGVSSQLEAVAMANDANWFAESVAV
jgi:two-component system nitrate/nitrite response regulator NarL